MTQKIMVTVPKQPKTISWMEDIVGVVKTQAINKKEIVR